MSQNLDELHTLVRQLRAELAWAARTGIQVVTPAVPPEEPPPMPDLPPPPGWNERPPPPPVQAEAPRPKPPVKRPADPRRPWEAYVPEPGAEPAEAAPPPKPRAPSGPLMPPNWAAGAPEAAVPDPAQPPVEASPPPRVEASPPAHARPPEAEAQPPEGVPAPRPVLEVVAQAPAPHPRVELVPAPPEPVRPALPGQAPGTSRIPILTAELAACDSLAAVQGVLGPCTRCKLHGQGRQKIVFGVGNPRADVMFVGEGPGADEDRVGEPFVGAAGQLLTKIIENGMGLQRAQVYIANVVKCRPPQNRDPEPDEVEACEPFLLAQIRLVQPRVLVTLGRPATHTLLRTTAPISRLRGKWTHFNGIPLMPTFHPAYVLRNPAEKRPVWEDIQEVMRFLNLPLPTPTRRGQA
jgi:uracil-DNA glycosylase family 4